MSFKAIFYAYVLGGLTFIPLVIFGIICFTIYTSVPVGDLDPSKSTRGKLERQSQEEASQDADDPALNTNATPDVNDLPRTRRGWLTVRRTFEEQPSDGSYVGLVRGFLDARSKDPKRSRPKDMWYVVLKGKILYLYEDESMTECEAAIELGSHDVVIYPEGLADGELFAKRNAICLKPKVPPPDEKMPSVTKEMKFSGTEEVKAQLEGNGDQLKEKEKAKLMELEKKKEEARAQALNSMTPWFIFVRSCVEMEDWYLALVHASDQPANQPTLAPLSPVFKPADMNHLVTTLDEQPDVIPMRWLNALLGRLFFSFYRTQTLESYIIGRLMRKLSKVKRPGFLTHIVVREVNVGNKAPTFSKPMLKELTKEGDAAMEVHVHYKGEARATVEALATINLGARFKTYQVKLVLAVVLRELEGNLLIKVKRPPSDRLWYAFTTMPKMVLEVEPVVSDRQITWGMILSTIESRLKEVIQESVVMPNMDDIAFFDSSKYSHRGGIWADASRTDKPPSLFETLANATVNSTPEEEKPATTEPDTQSSKRTSETNPEPRPVLNRSHSAEEAETEVSKPPENATLPRPATFSAPSVTPNASSSSTSSKRKSWFTAVRESGDDPFLDPGDETVQRGRSAIVEDGAPRRAGSTPSPHEPSQVSNEPDAQDPDGQAESDTHLSAIPIKRTSSRRSRSSSSHDVSDPSSTEATSTSAPSESLLTAFRSRSPTGSTSRKETLSNNASTFFQTLKSRDKQAISNTAKEAIRKWGVNWGSLKKDNNVGGNSGDEIPDGESRAPKQESTVHKPRPSYAEVRAAVEQRKERERAAQGSQSVEPARSNGETSSQGGYDRSRPTNGLPGDEQRPTSPPYNHGAALSPSTSPRPPEEGSTSGQSRSNSPRPRTISRLSNTSEGVANLPEDVEHPSDVPIHTRPPQPKMMTIPGIHASHRGEVMSMGYAPPTPPTEPKKAPAIQSVYRLWKNTNTSGQQSQHASPQVQTGSAGVDQDALPSTSSNSNEGAAQPEPPAPVTRPVPPPLPPRSSTTQALHTKPDSPRNVAETEQATASPASAALQSIVSRDRSKRESMGSPGYNAMSSNPPSPGRNLKAEAEDGKDQSSTGGDGEPSTAVFSSPPPSSPSPAKLSSAEPGVNISPTPPALPPRRIQTPA